jgi:hypothetical protein
VSRSHPNTIHWPISLNLLAIIGLPNLRNNAREKLTRLTRVQFQELSTDVYDELIRRKRFASSVDKGDSDALYRQGGRAILTQDLLYRGGSCRTVRLSPEAQSSSPEARQSPGDAFSGSS